MKHLRSCIRIAAAIAVPAMAAVLPQTLPAGMVVCRPMQAGGDAQCFDGKTELMCRAVDVPWRTLRFRKFAP